MRLRRRPSGSSNSILALFHPFGRACRWPIECSASRQPSGFSGSEPCFAESRLEAEMTGASSSPDGAKALRVVHCVGFYLPETVGGTEVYVRDLAAALSEHSI